MAKKHVVVVGAGIAGLSAASYLLRNGYEVTVVEQHTLPGGLCTSWKRKGYTIDYCVHWLMGTDGESDFYRIWEELGAFDNEDGSSVPIVDFTDFTTIELSNGEKVCLYSDLKKLRHELLRIAPEDEKEIDRFCKSVEKLGNLSMPALTEQNSLVKSVRRIASSVGGFTTMMRHLVSMEVYANRFKSPLLKELFLTEIPAEWSLISLTMGLSQQPKKSAGYTVGGSLNLAKNIERVIRGLGGTILYGKAVSRILVERDVAVGVQLVDGTSIEADYVIGAADGHATLYHLLEGKYLNKQLEDIYKHFPLFPSTVFVAIGVDKDCSALPHIFTPYLKTPIRFPDGAEHRRFGVNVYHYDPTLAPKGKTLVTVLFNTWEGEAWEELYRKDKDLYEREKQRIGEEVVDRLESIIGDFSAHVEMVDVSTPHTVIKYTGNWKGSFEGFAPTKRTLSVKVPKQLPGLRNFSMIGQWTSPGGGLPTAAKDGRDIAIQLCREDGKVFTSER
jgi:phytoene dehydrogenase-like protein